MIASRLGAVALAAALVWVVLEPPPARHELAPEVAGALEATGATHPVTAVLLGFRAYDTLLEVVVVLLAVLAALAAGGQAASGAPPAAAPGSVLRALASALVPVMLLAAGYLLWAGTTQPGGAFQAGAVLAAGGVLLVLAGMLEPPDAERTGVRFVLVAGPATFLAAFLSGTLAQAILLVEALLAASIALSLLCLFGAARR